MIGEKLKILRKKNNLTQNELAEKLGVSTGAVGLWELNKREPDLEMLVKISEIFKVSTDYLIKDEENNIVTIIGNNGTFSKFKLSDDCLETIEKLARKLNIDDINQ